MDLSSLTHATLWNKTERLIKHERKVVLSTIHHLSEIQRRRLYAEHGFNSLWDMLVRGHHFSDGAASRRINAVHLLGMHPQIEEKIASGAINLTNASALYVCFKNEALAYEDQIELIQNVEKKSTRAAKKAIAEKAPQPLPQDKEEPLDGEHTLYTHVVTAQTHEQMQKLKAEFSHINPNMSKDEILRRLADFYFKKNRKKRKSPPAAKAGPLAPAMKEFILERDGYRCTHPGCGATHQIEVDHIQPQNFGGTNDPENLRALCKTHNLMHAERCYGKKKMETYLRH